MVFIARDLTSQIIKSLTIQPLVYQSSTSHLISKPQSSGKIMEIFNSLIPIGNHQHMETQT
jgi:hypothetical protein